MGYWLWVMGCNGNKPKTKNRQPKTKIGYGVVMELNLKPKTNNLKPKWVMGYGLSW